MGLASTLLNATGVLFLIHAVYSSYEHSLLDDIAVTASPSLQTTAPSNPLPIDIIVELLFAVILLCAGIVLSSANLKPITWSTWAGQLERSKDARRVTAFGEGGGSPYARFEDRVGFLDVRSGRKQKS